MPDLDKLFNWTAPAEGDQVRYSAVRAACYQAARTVEQYCPANMDAVTAVYKLREAWFFANEALQKKV